VCTNGEHEPEQPALSVLGGEGADETGDLPILILGGNTMTDYGAKSRQQMMARYVVERRKRHLRRIGYHILDIAGLWLWCMVGVMVTAAVIFCVAHR
jgi:hypothetical protein